MIAVVTLVALMAAYLVANALTQTQAGLASARELRTQLALREAKRGLIAWAASETLQRPESGRNFQPGGLPCPDLDNDGIAESCGIDPSKRLGRLPWKTLGIEDLRDASGERLWYAVSYNFVKTTTTTAINSDTSGTLTVTGVAPASNIVAVILAPGIALQQNPNVQGALQNQVRDPTSSAAINAPSNYFEGQNGGPNDDVFTVANVTSDIANDRLAVVTAADLMDAVEPNVAALMSTRGLEFGAQKTIKDFINTYYTDWGKYPFPARFTNPNTSAYKGDTTQSEGFLPMTTEPGFVAWQDPAGTVTITKASTYGSVNLPADCSASVALLIDCQFKYDGASGDPGGPVIELSATVSNAARALVAKNTSSQLTVMRRLFGLWFPYSLKQPACDAMVAPPANEPYCFQSGNALQVNGNGTVALRMQLPLTTFMTTVRLQIAVPPYSELSSPADSSSDAWWFVWNQWYKQVHYAVSPAYLPGGNAALCNPPPGNPPPSSTTQCLFVKGFSGTSTSILPSAQNGYLGSPASTVKALLVLSGRSINGQVRPSSNPIDYFEGENAIQGDLNLESRLGVPGFKAWSTDPPASNDRAVVVAP